MLLAPGDDLRRVARRLVPPDLILGGPASAYREIAAGGLFEPVEKNGPPWMVARRGLVGVLNRVRDRGTSVRPDHPLDDPRRDPVSLARAEVVLRSGPWPDSYAFLVREAGLSSAPGRQPGSALAAFDRRETASAVAVGPTPPGGPPPKDTVFVASERAGWGEGVAVVRGARHAEASRAMLRALAGVGRVGPPEDPTGGTGSSSLLADLLGSTLVESREELVASWRALGAAGEPERPLKWMTEAPPWPPASVSKILERDPNPMPLLETLAAQIAPEADVRAWLLRSWLSRPRRVDGPWLDELAAAVDGRLAREPRFRAWLRGEWTAWARQRYRRVARQAGGWTPGGAVAGAPS